jgi:large subunit ribosomal protein L28
MTGPRILERTRVGVVGLGFVTLVLVELVTFPFRKVLSVMARRCEICDKGPVVGRTVSHAHNVGPRRFEPNLQTVRAVVNGATKRMRVCTRCIRSKKVVKAA